MEGAEQKAFVKWFRETYPDDQQCLRVSLRGLNFGSGPRAARMINYIKSQGSVNGESDLALLIPKGGYGALVIEHKGDGMARKVTKDQRSYLNYHNSVGNLATSTRGLEELKKAVASYMGQTDENTLLYS